MAAVERSSILFTLSKSSFKALNSTLGMEEGGVTELDIVRLYSTSLVTFSA